MLNQIGRKIGFSAMLALSLICTRAAEGRTLVVDQKYPQANDTGQGTAAAPFKTISAAAKQAQPGDTVLVHAGTYRERVTPERSGSKAAPITYQAAPDEVVTIKGSDVWKPEWKKIETNVHEGSLKTVVFAGINPFHRTISLGGKDNSKVARPAEGETLPETLGQIFVNGKPYLQVMSEKAVSATPGTWFVNAAGDAIRIHFKNGDADPSKQLVEISTRDRIFSPYRRGLRHIHVRGFVMEHCANQGPFPQNGALSIRSGRNWVIENNTIRHAKTCGLDIGSEGWNGKEIAASAPTAKEDQRLMFAGNNLIRNNVVSDNGLCGIVGWNHHGTMIVGNIIERNNRLGFPHGRGWEEWAGIKLHCTNALIAGNLVRDNEAHGIWVDNGYRNCHITRNVVLNNLQSGIFLELGGGTPDCLIDNNIIGFTRSQGGFYNGNGIYTHDASHLTMAHNLFIANAGYGVAQRIVTARKYDGKVVTVTNEKILNNIFVGNSMGCISWPADSPRSGNNVANYNIYDIGGGIADFHINRFNMPFDWDKVTVKLEEALKGAQVEEAKWPNLKGWKHNSTLNFDAWRAFMEVDAHSIRTSAREGKTYIKLRARQPELVFKPADYILKMKCPKVEDADLDFYGNPIPADGAIPGPFQKLGADSVTLPLINTIKKPAIRLTPSQKKAKRMRETIEAASKEIKKGEPGATYKITDKTEGMWFASSQAKKNPGLTDAFAPLAPLQSLKLSAKSTSKGPSHGPSKVVLFKAPADARFSYSTSAKLTRRTAATAGYAGAELFVLDDTMQNAISLDTQYANTKGGYKSETHDDSFEFKGEVALRKGWYLALRLQVVSPGPAPAGYADVTIETFEVTNK